MEQIAEAVEAAEVAKPASTVEAVEAIATLPGLVVEVCGTWVWVSGETKQHKDALKMKGFRWASKKARWYWCPVGSGRAKFGFTMNRIRQRYGSETYRTRDEERAPV